MDSPLKKEFAWFLANLQQLLDNYRGKYVVVRDCAVVGAFENEEAAIAGGKTRFPLGTFLVQKVEPDADAYTQTFPSRVVFA